MAKLKTSYFCTDCGAESPKWVGKCSSCGNWNTYVEEVTTTSKQKDTLVEVDTKVSAKRISEIEQEGNARLKTNDFELNRVLGGGIVEGSVILLGGEPGIGKSTLLLQLAKYLEQTTTILYIAGEESAQQVKMRANRVGTTNNNFFVLPVIAVNKVFEEAKRINPKIIVVDSIQSMQSPFLESTPGSISQIKECAAELLRYAKQTNTAIFIIGHITKDGNIAGPKLLEHMVDTVLQFEGDRHYSYRILRTLKNRFGSTSELGIYEMLQNGLQPVENPSELLISPKDDSLSGVAISATIEGLRPMLIEVQALVSPSAYGNPQRSATGYGLKRLSMLLAVLEKRCGYKFGNYDVFVNIAGGISVQDPGIDLAVISALISSLEDIPIDSRYCFAGEVGLSGEVRGISRIDQRITEAEKLGFSSIFTSGYNKSKVNKESAKLLNVPIKKVSEIVNQLFLKAQ